MPSKREPQPERARHVWAWQWPDGSLDIEVATIRDAAMFTEQFIALGCEGEIVRGVLLPSTYFHRLKRQAASNERLRKLCEKLVTDCKDGKTSPKEILNCYVPQIDAELGGDKDA